MIHPDAEHMIADWLATGKSIDDHLKGLRFCSCDPERIEIIRSVLLDYVEERKSVIWSIM